MVPCDAPNLPDNLVERLLDTATGEHKTCALVSDADEWQPTFSVWHVDLLSSLETSVNQGMRGLKQFLAITDPALLDWHAEARPRVGPDPFANINSRPDLDALRNFHDPR